MLFLSSWLQVAHPCLCSQCSLWGKIGMSPLWRNVWMIGKLRICFQLTFPMVETVGPENSLCLVLCWPRERAMKWNIRGLNIWFPFFFVLKAKGPREVLASLLSVGTFRMVYFLCIVAVGFLQGERSPRILLHHFADVTLSIFWKYLE